MRGPLGSRTMWAVGDGPGMRRDLVEHPRAVTANCGLTSVCRAAAAPLTPDGSSVPFLAAY